MSELCEQRPPDFVGEQDVAKAETLSGDHPDGHADLADVAHDLEDVGDGGLMGPRAGMALARSAACNRLK
ncbi:hypothetical protein GCM10010106_38910 [Thermopolyspora flexuosa]|nr:hypothetical protein GCM10010106_38910 [Thermopolyspora flexuosa]